MLHGNCQCIRSPVRCSCLDKIPRQMESVICPTLVFKILCEVEVLVFCFKTLVLWKLSVYEIHGRCTLYDNVLCL